MSEEMSTKTLIVTGLHCGSCVANVREALLEVPGVTSAELDLDSGRAEVVTAAGGPDTAALIAAVAAAGDFTAVSA